MLSELMPLDAVSLETLFAESCLVFETREVLVAGQLIWGRQRKQLQAETAFFVGSTCCLKADLRACCKSKIVIGAVIEVDFVTGFHANTEPAGVELHSSAWVKHAVGIAVTNGADLVRKSARSCRSANAKIQ